MFTDHTITPRSEHTLRCIYAILGLIIPHFILTALGSGALSLWVIHLGMAFSFVYGTALPIITYQTRLANAQRALGSAQAPPPSAFSHPLPPLTRLPAIIAAFVIGLVWAGALAVTILYMVYWNGDMWLYIVAIIHCVFYCPQIGLWFAVGIMSSLERKVLTAKGRGVYQAPGAMQSTTGVVQPQQVGGSQQSQQMQSYQPPQQQSYYPPQGQMQFQPPQNVHANQNAEAPQQTQGVSTVLGQTQYTPVQAL